MKSKKKKTYCTSIMKITWLTLYKQRRCLLEQLYNRTKNIKYKGWGKNYFPKVQHSGTYINLLKPTGHVMHYQFNIQQLYALPTLYLCVLYLSENKQRLVPLTA